LRTVVLSLLLAPAFALDAPEAPAEHARIVNGERASLDLHPATGGLLFAGTVEVPPLFGPAQTVEMKQFTCSSTLIAPDVVLLAAHCVDEAVLSQGGSVRGATFAWSRQVDLSEPNQPGDPWPDDAVLAADWAIPSQWSINNINDFSVGDAKWDIAMLFLEEPVLDVTPAILPTAEESADLQTGDPVEIVGWGLQTPATIFDQFLPPDPDTFARKFWGSSVLGDVGTYEIQVADSPDDPRKCKGDSGGPTFMELAPGTEFPMRLIGVTSRSADFTLCAEKGGYDTRVDAYLDWIDDEMRAACEDGTRVWCEEPGILPASWAEGEQGKGGCNSAPGVLLAGLFSLGFARRRRRR
jgi:hypothetical protein